MVDNVRQEYSEFARFGLSWAWRIHFSGRVQNEMKSTAPCLRYLLVFVLSSGAASGCFADTGERQVVGWLERVALTDHGAIFEAKVDTGADTSSVHAENIRHFLRDDRQWVEFTLHDRAGRSYTLQRPLERTARIKKKTRGSQERPVVILKVCVGKQRRSVEVNLSQRAHFRFPVLLGRNFLSGHYVVDAGATYLLPPACPSLVTQ